MKNNMNNYGTLTNYKTGEAIRPATKAEWQASREAEASNIGGGTGAIEVDGQSVYVDGGPEGRVECTTEKKAPKFSPKSVRIFEEADGYHYCDAKLDYLDARGKGYPSRAAAMRAAREDHDMMVAYGLI